MIALEVLLTKQGDAYGKVLAVRAKAFVGWFDRWSREGWADKINALYKRRCQFVHDGDSSAISIPDVLFTDRLVRNILTNILRGIHLFPHKEALISFCDKIAAQELLGLDDVLRPKDFTFIYRDPTASELERL